jgi:hypothetical protein
MPRRKTEGDHLSHFAGLFVLFKTNFCYPPLCHLILPFTLVCKPHMLYSLLPRVSPFSTWLHSSRVPVWCETHYISRAVNLISEVRQFSINHCHCQSAPYVNFIQFVIWCSDVFTSVCRANIELPQQGPFALESSYLVSEADVTGARGADQLPNCWLPTSAETSVSRYMI